MGKKAKKEREEKRDSFAAQRSKSKKKNTLIAIGVLAVIAIIIGYAGYSFVTMQTNAPGAPKGAGKLGDEHEHASLLVKIFGDKFDFSLPAYQVKSSWIHFEGHDGNTVHRHASGVKLGFLFQSLGITLTDKCYDFPDGRKFCTNDDYSLKFFINHEKVLDIRDYVIKEKDRILISYGNENSAEIEKQLAELDAQEIIE